MNKEYYAEYSVRERQHWWFLARLEILRDRVARFRPTLRQDEPLRILNAGIATGATSLMLADFGEVTNLEYDADCCTFVRDKLGLEVVNGSLTELPFPDGTFDLICAFDVVEHIEADDLALQ
ncbi:MAG: methyltransferase domain-containing protein, partial [Bacteroidota bacterium]